MVMTSFGRHANGRYVLDLRLSQDNWAAMAGLTRQTVNKELGRLKSDGLIALENGKLVILNREAIKQIAYY
jgi:CRP-like cAMP-binding protein